LAIQGANTVWGGSSSFIIQDSDQNQGRANILYRKRDNGGTNGGFYFALTTDATVPTTAHTKMTIQENGNVGIGTTSPGTKLEVDGVITATGGTSTNWNTAYTDRLNWNGGTTGLTAATGRSSLGLGSLATLSTVAAATITDNTVGSAELVASPAFTNPTCATPSSSTHVANKAYVDAASGGGCYSKCADSGTAAGGATPTCAAGYTSVDTWSERAGYAMKQWQGMNSAAYSTGATGPTYSGPTTGTTSKTFTYGWNIGDTDAWGRTFNYSVAIPWAYKSAYYGKWAWNTGYTGGSSTANYYNDCTACCAD